MTKPPNALTRAQEYLSRGWAPVPVPYGKKGPVLRGWPALNISSKNVEEYFDGTPQNIGVRLGTISGGLVDIDLDSDATRTLAPLILPTTSAIFGRSSSPKSHWLYRSEARSEHFKSPQHGMLVEIRGEGSGVLQTIFPGSTHEGTGEAIEWAENGRPSDIPSERLRRAVGQLAACALVTEYWVDHAHNELNTTFIGVLLRAGLGADAIRDMIGGICGAAGDEKVEKRVARIQAIEATGPDRWRGYPKLIEHTDNKAAALIFKWLGLSNEIVQLSVLLGPSAAMGSYYAWHGPPFEPPQVVERYMLQEGGGFVSPGGLGKSTLLSYEAVKIRLGEKLYGREILQPGTTLIITAEDRREIVVSRFNMICTALGLTPQQREYVRAGIFIEDVSSAFVKIVSADPRTGSLTPTPFVDEIIDHYSGAKLACVILDPTSLMGPGEQSGNDGMAEFMRTVRHLSSSLRAAVRAVHHVSQTVARNGIADQYAGRGGTAWADGSRFQHQLLCVAERQLKTQSGIFRVPNEATDEDLAQGRVLAVVTHKASYTERPEIPVLVLRRGFSYTHLTPDIVGPPSAASREKATEAHAKILRGFCLHKQQQGFRLTATEIASDWRGEIGLNRDNIRAAITAGKHLGLLVEEPLPDGQRHGARKNWIRATDSDSM